MRAKVADEHLEAMWMLLEKRGDIRGSISIERFSQIYHAIYSSTVIDQLAADGFLHSADDALSFTEAGYEKSRQLIRAHRLAERLLNDVLGIDDYEVGACEFEHIIDTNLIDSICTLLGHPDHGPDGLPIPPGDCCSNRNTPQPNPTVPISTLSLGDGGRVASVHADDDTRLHVLENLQIRPGSLLHVHQLAPTIVIECEGSIVAIDDEIADHIHVWPLRPEKRDGPPSFRKGRRRHHQRLRKNR